MRGFDRIGRGFAKIEKNVIRTTTLPMFEHSTTIEISGLRACGCAAARCCGDAALQCSRGVPLLACAADIFVAALTSLLTTTTIAMSMAQPTLYSTLLAAFFALYRAMC